METKSEGRELMVEFTCRRCKRKKLERYEDVMKGETYGYLHASKLPEGWGTIGYSSIACQECVAAYERFLKMEERNDESDD